MTPALAGGSASLEPARAASPAVGPSGLEAAIPLSLVCPKCRAPLNRESSAWCCASCRDSYPEEGGIVHLLAGRTGAPAFDGRYFETLAPVEDRHFWYVARRRLIVDVLLRTIPDFTRRPLFDVGCGSGGLLSFLGAAGIPLAGACDAYLQGLEHARRRLGALPLLLVDEGRLPPLGPGQTMVTLFDVLEHLDDDLGTLRWIESVLEPGGLLVLTVPAHPFLFDEMDELAHHRRRYTRSQLRRRLEAAGLQVRFLSHFMCPLAPLLFVLRAMGRFFYAKGTGASARRNAELRVVPALNGLLTSVLAMERYALRLFSLPFGTSIIAVAARPVGSAGFGPRPESSPQGL